MLVVAHSETELKRLSQTSERMNFAVGVTAWTSSRNCFDWILCL